MKKRILLTGIGGGGTNNLYRDITLSKLQLDEFEFFGSNLDKQVIGRSPLSKNFVLPSASSPEYTEVLNTLIAREGIDLIIPNNDREVGRISEDRDKINCRLFLPEDEAVKSCQDKFVFYERLRDEIPMAKSIELKSLDDVEPTMNEIGGDKVWVRPKSGSGSKGASWVYNAEQARNFIKLWIELRGFDVEDYTISEFLPGRDFCFQSVWNEGELVVAKMCERLSYYGGANRISGMSSSPEIAKTIYDQAAYDTIFKAIHLLSDKPHGNFNFDLKGRDATEMCVTECNVGRFCMITPIFDLTGEHSTVEMYIRAAFNESLPVNNSIDYQEDMYLLRELDNLPRIMSAEMIENHSIDLTP